MGGLVISVKGGGAYGKVVEIPSDHLERSKINYHNHKEITAPGQR